MNYNFIWILSLFSFSMLGAQIPAEGQFMHRDGQNYPATFWNQAVGFSKIEITSSNMMLSSMNNFVCDAILEMTQTDFAFINYGDITANFYPGEITELDLAALCSCNRTLVILEVDGAFLLELIESKISRFNPGLAIAGGLVEYDINRPSKNRLTFFRIGNHPVYPKKDYRIVTTDYLAKGNAGFDLLTTIDSAKTIQTGIILREAVREYILRHSPLDTMNVRSDERWIEKSD